MEDKAMTLAKLSSDNYRNNWFPSMPSFFDRFFDDGLMDPMTIGWNNSNYSSTNTTMPAVNIIENENEFSIEVAAPGMNKEDFKVSFENGRLTISSEKKNVHEDKENQKATRREFSYQSFQRSFTVATNTVDADKIMAHYENGILTITLPKREEVKPKPAKQIEIK